MSYKILIIDDEIPMLQCLERILRERGDLLVRSLSNSLEVNDLLDEGLFDVVITDLRMPGFSGIDVSRSILEKGRGESVIIITAFAGLDSAIEAIGANVTEYIVKPFTRDQINTALTKAITIRKQFLASKQYDRYMKCESIDAAVEALKRDYSKIHPPKAGYRN